MNEKNNSQNETKLSYACVCENISLKKKKQQQQNERNISSVLLFYFECKDGIWQSNSKLNKHENDANARLASVR